MSKAQRALWLALLTALLTGCDSPIDDYCDAWCDCVDCNEALRQACVDARENDETRAHEHGCEDEWEDFVTCVADTYYCHEDELLHGCESQELRWTSCVD